MKQNKTIVTVVFVGLIVSVISVVAQGMTGQGMMRQGMMGMMESVESEYDFFTLMIPHHQEAIESAQQLLQVTERAQMRELANTIIETQSAEIETMQGWLEQWYPSRNHKASYTSMMSDLNGLATDEAERLFLEDMIVHHGMAVHMSQQLRMRGLVEHEPVEGFVRDIATNQMAEIRLMGQWLQDWYGITMPMGQMMNRMHRSTP